MCAVGSMVDLIQYLSNIRNPKPIKILQIDINLLVS
jgi:hypothetical protein